MVETMKVITCNLNGIRAAARKGFFDWMQAEDPDFVCMQETKAQMQHLPDECFYPKGYHHMFSNAEKKGYSGVGIYSKLKPDNVIFSMDLDWADNEGRFIEAVFGNLHIISIYFPSGSSGDERQALKYNFMEKFYENHASKANNSQKKYIICGDFNIVHKEIDIKNWRANQKNSGCLPKERAWLDSCQANLGFVDAFREICTEPEQYTWWSNRGRAWQNNVGWRIDYQMLSANLSGTVDSVFIYKNERFSDHAPCVIKYINDVGSYVA